jgi:hypothetical protein
MGCQHRNVYLFVLQFSIVHVIQNFSEHYFAKFRRFNKTHNGKHPKGNFFRKVYVKLYGIIPPKTK